MSVYPPLKFIEQMENYIELVGNRGMEGEINNKSMQFAEEYTSKNRSKIYRDCSILRDGGTKREVREVIENYKGVFLDYNKNLGVSASGNGYSIRDFVDLLTYYDVRNIWRKNKLSYIVDNELFYTLIDMKPPKLAPVDCLTKLPASCFYIDYNGLGYELCKDLDGTFIVSDKTDDDLMIFLLHLLKGNNGKELFMTTMYKLPLDSDMDKFNPSCSVPKSDTLVLCEDGVKRAVNEGKLFKFIHNFLIYLHAANRDVEISERTRKGHEKPPATIKNKFREVKEFKVGFSYAKTIRQGNTRIKYIDGQGKSGVSGKPKCSHYRSAHWHHYWTGSGENKKLVIKWVEGVFVNGTESDNVSVHKVK